MGRKSGQRSKAAHEKPRTTWSYLDAVVVFGMLVSLGLIAVSVALNYRMGYRSADNALDGTLYGTGAACGDCLKAIAPFMASWGFKHGDMLAATSAAIVFVICTSFSFVSAVGFAAEHRAVKHASAQGGKNAYIDYTREKERLQSRLAFLGQQRTTSEVDGAIADALKQRAWTGGPTVGTWTRDCSIDRKQTRTACENVAELKTERARAADYGSVLSELAKLVETTRGSGQITPVSTVDAQVDALKDALDLLSAKVGKDQIGLSLGLLLGLFIEIGSGVGLFISTTPWRTSNLPQTSKLRLGHVDAFMLDALSPGEGLVTEQELHGAYLMWCSARGEAPYNLKEFAPRLADLAKDTGLEATFRGQRRHYRNVQLTR